MARSGNSIGTENIEEDADGDSVASSSSSHCTLKACSASMDLHSSSSTRLSPSAPPPSLLASIPKTSMTRALSNTCIQAVTSGTEIGSSFIPDLVSKTMKQQSESWINYGLLGTKSLSSSSSLIFPKAPEPLFKQNFVANWITKANSQPEGPNIVPLLGATKDDKSDYQQHGGGDMRWLDNLGRGYHDDRQNTDDVSMDTQDDKPTEIGSPLFNYQRNSTAWFKHNGETNAMETDACMPSAPCYIRPASFMYNNEVIMTSPSEQITRQSVLDMGEPMDLDDKEQMFSWTQRNSSFFARPTYNTAASTDISMIIDNNVQEECQPMMVDSMLPQTRMGHGLFISQSKANIEMLSPTPSIEMLSPTPSIEMLSPTPSIEMLSPTPSIEMLSPTPSIEMLSPTHSKEMLCPTPSILFHNAATHMLATSQSKTNVEMASPTSLTIPLRKANSQSNANIEHIPKFAYVSLDNIPKLSQADSTTFCSGTFNTSSLNIPATTPFVTRVIDTKRKPANKRKHRHDDDDDKESPAKRRVIAKTSTDNIHKYLKPLKHHKFLRTRNK